MTQFVLIEASPWRASDGVAVDVRLAGGGGAGRPYDQRGFTDWRAGVVERPRFSAAFGYGENGWTGGALPQAASVVFFPASKELLTELATAYLWIGAAITIRSGDDELATPVYVMEMTGTVAGTTVRDGALNLVLTDLSGKLDRPHTTATFAGTGGLEGVAEAEGRVKRRTYGFVRHVEGRVLDKATNVFEFGDPNVVLVGLTDVSDMGRAGPTTALGWQGSALATLDALKAAVPPAGGAVVAPSIACVKWWTVPNGPLTADVQADTFGVGNKAADVAVRLVNSSADGAAMTFEGTSRTAIQAARAATTGIHIEDDSETTASALDRLLVPLSVLWSVDNAGVIRMSEVKLTDPVETITGQSFERVETYRPAKSVRVGYRKNYRKHNDGEISAAVLTSDISDLGELGRANSVRLGTPAVLDENGVQLVPTAFRTSAGQAATIAGQAATATNSDFSVITGGTRPANNATVGADVNLNVVDSFGGTTITLPRNEVRTPLGTAAAITGQGSFATRSTLGFRDSAALTGVPLILTDTVTSDLQERIQAGYIRNVGAASYLTDRWPEEGNANRTEGRTASAITGQGSLATRSRARFGLHVYRADDLTLINDSDAITSLGTASAIAGQGPFATDARSPLALFGPNANMVYNGGFKLRLDGWTGDANWQWTQGGVEGAYSYTTVGGTIVRQSRAFPVYQNTTFNLSAEIYTLLSAGLLVLDVLWYNDAAGTVGNAVASSPRLAQGGSTNWNRRTVSFVSPSGANSARIRFFLEGATVTGTNGVRRIKFDGGVAQSPFSDETTDGALYSDGSTIDAFRPQELSANRTEGRQASSIVGQGGFATRSTIDGDNDFAVGTGLRNRLTPYANDFNFLAASRMAWDGTGGTVQALKPGEANANVTENRTAGAIAGQGALATRGNIDVDGHLGGNLAIRLAGFATDGRFLKAGQMLYADSNTVEGFKPLEAGSDKTANRQAASIVGQGGFATRSTLGFREGAALTGVPAMLTDTVVKPADGVERLRAAYIRNEVAAVDLTDRWPEEGNANRTEGRQASTIAGQGTFATRSNIDSDAHLVGVLANRLAGHGTDGNYLAAGRVMYFDNATAESRRPEEANANRTETRRASAITGQGPWATEGRATRTLYQGRANQIRNGGFRLGLTSWVQFGAVWAHNVGTNESAYAIGFGTNVFYIQTDPFAVYENADYTVQAEGVISGLGTGSAYFDIEWRNGAQGVISYSAGVGFINNGDWNRVLGNRIAPAGTQFAVVRMIAANMNGTANPYLAIRRIKMSISSDDVPFTDEMTDGANATRFIGRAPKASAFMPPSWSVGITSLSNLFPISDVDNGANITINITAFTKTLDDGTAVNYPAASFPGWPYSTRTYWWREDGQLDGGTGYGGSRNITDARGPTKVYLGAFNTRAAGAASPGTGFPPGGDTCVATYSFVEVRDPLGRDAVDVGGRYWIRAIGVAPGDFIRVLTPEGGTAWRGVTANKAAFAEGFLITLPNGHAIDLSASTPITLQDGSTVLASEADGAIAASDVDGEVVWLPCSSVPIGLIPVSFISASDGTYLAGNVAGRGVFSHNATLKQ